jgi:transketolase N-terminal domain/subunit
MELEEVLQFLKERQNLEDLKAVLSIYSPEVVESAYKSIRRQKRKQKKKKKGTIEEFLEFTLEKGYEKNGYYPPIEELRKIIHEHFSVPLKEDGKLPAHVELLIARVKNRVKVRIHRRRKKKKQSLDSQ